MSQSILIITRLISADTLASHRTNLSKYINDKKIKEAINLIIHTDDPIETICHQVGFNDKNSFIIYSKYTEMNPFSEMRKLKSENKLEDTTKHLFIYHGDDFKDN